MDVHHLMNLTRHDVVIDATGLGGGVLTVVASGDFARLSEKRGRRDTLEFNGVRVPVTAVSNGEPQGVPEPVDGVGYIVSRLTAAALRRPDVYFPLDEIRDQEGHIVGCRGLGQFQETEAEGSAADSSVAS